MLKLYKRVENGFEKLTFMVTAIHGNSVTFIAALGLVVFWLSHHQFFLLDTHQKIGDIILSITFLSLFIIQKSSNRFSGSLHLKVNELVASHETASNALINVEEKTEREVMELSKEYIELALIEKMKKESLTKKTKKIYTALNRKVKSLLPLLAIAVALSDL